MLKRKYAALALSSMLFLGGCSMWPGNDSSKNDNDADSIANENGNGNVANNKMEDYGSLDNFTSWMNDNEIAYSNVKTIDNMEFAAEEGRSFMIDNQMVYLYRIKTEDTKMNSLMKEAKSSGMTKVMINGEEKEYKAYVNGNYLLLHDKDIDISPLSQQFSTFTRNPLTSQTNYNNE